MLDYRNNLKRILQNTAGDDQSLENSLNAIKAIIGMADSGSENKSRKVVKSKSIPEKNAEDKQIKQLLSSLAKLIAMPGNEAAKRDALSALHKLTFASVVGKRFGSEIGKLDQAIQRSNTTKDAVNAQIFQEAIKPKEQPKRDYRKGKRYTVIRLVSGADLVNNGQTVFTVKESQVRPLNLKTGDIVEALEDHNNPNYEAEILRVVGYEKLRKRDYDQIEEFRYAVVQGSQGSLSISRNVRGEKLKIRGKEVVVPVDSSYYQGDGINLVDGSIVDLAWYSGDVRLKKNPADAIQIRWIYEVDQPEHSSKQNKKKKKDSNKEFQDLPALDMDLHYQRVGIAIGDNQNEKLLESIVSRYNGIPIGIDAFEGKKKVLENQIKDLDIVILVTAFAAHDSTWSIREFASKYHVKFAVSSSKGYQSFERALYRADQDLPAYEGTQSIEYKQKSK